MKDITEIANEHREELDRLMEDRRRAEDAAARKHGIDINSFFGQLDERVYHDPEVEAIQRRIDDIYGRHD